VGQAEAIRQVAQRVRLARTGLTDADRPAGVFLFLGPSGVGKTELVRGLAETALAHPDTEGSSEGTSRLIRLDLSEYGERHHAARLIGAPPGYLGHEEEGQLTGRLRRMPHAVVLLDEVEKAHPEVLDLFLQLFGEGRLTDGHGRLVDGRQAIFVLTSNLVVRGAGRRALGFGRERPRDLAPEPVGESQPTPEREGLLAELRQFFRPELLNRIDEVVLFQPLGEADLAEIVRRRLAALGQRLLDQHEIVLTVSDAALSLLARRAMAGSGGAREAQRVITRLIEEPLSREVLSGRLGRRDRLRVEAQGDALALVRESRTI
jgi:ATP-dependent Clp protease ATP-binding subunit ClpC